MPSPSSRRWRGAVAPVAEAQPPIRIGATPAQTGVVAAPGQNQFRGYQLCVKHLNEKGGVLGRKLELLVYDDGSDPATAVRLYEKLITQDGPLARLRSPRPLSVPVGQQRHIDQVLRQCWGTWRPALVVTFQYA